MGLKGLKMPDLEWVDAYVTETFDRVERFRKRMLAEFEAGPMRQGTTVHVKVSAEGKRPCGCSVVGETVYPCRSHQVHAFEALSGLDLDIWERRVAETTRPLAPDVQYALVMSRDALMAGCAKHAAIGPALDAINAVLLRAGFVWHQPMRNDGYGHVTPFGPAILVEPKS